MSGLTWPKDYTRYVSHAASDEYREGWDRIFGRRPCGTCGGAGSVEVGRHRVTREMALDAGEPAMEGMDGGPQYGPCPACDGTGQQPKEEAK